MPGLSLVCDLTAPIENQLAALLSGNDVGGHGGNLSSILWRDGHVVLLSSGYPEYPIEFHETPDHLVCVEGRVYQAPESPWHRSLPIIAADLLSDESTGVARAARWISEIDGDFVVAFQDRRSRSVVIFNDFLGRLPLYVHRTDGSVIVSRDLSLLMRATGRVTFDRLALAEHLLYGYPLGPRTLFSGIERVAAATAIQVRRQAKRIILSNLLVPSVASDPGVTSETLKDTAKDLSSAFARACTARVRDTRGTVLGLSGGLDSRSVAAALSANRLPFLAVTRSTKSSDVETRIAANVASVLQLNWRTMHVSQPTGSDLLRLLQLKGGMNYLGMAFILPFFDSLQAECGREIGFLTGDGGDKLLPDLRPGIRLRQRQALVRCILANHEIFPLRTVVALTHVSRSDILAALEARILSYPEEEFEEKYIHFILFERAFKWLFEGEDRNRHFFWSAAPFYGLELFGRAMKCPPLLKANYSLYRLFIESLNAELVDVESTTCGRSLGSGHSVDHLLRDVRRWTRARMPQSLRRRFRGLRRQPVAGNVVACIREQLARASPISDYLSPSHVSAVLEGLGPSQAYMLFTLTTAIEYFTTGRSTLERYHDAYF